MTASTSSRSTKRCMPFESRKAWLLARIAKQHNVDILDAAFVAEYADITGTRFKPAPWGAGWCPQLARDLRTLMHLKLLKRWACGLSSGAWQPGFPKWVYSYSLTTDGTAALAERVEYPTHPSSSESIP